MRKISAIMAAFFLCAGVLTACRETPGEVIVTPKGQQGNVYEDDTPGVVQKVGEKAGIQDAYSMSLTSADERTDFTANIVKVNYPDVNELPVYEVSLREFDQDFVDEITEAIFGDTSVYHEWDYLTRTKAEIMEEIQYIKECMAKGNMDPYNMNFEGSAEAAFDIERYLVKLEEEYDCSPEQYTHKTVTPKLGFDPEKNGYERPYYGEESYPENYFTGYGEIDGKFYYYRLDGGTDGGKDTSIYISRDRNEEYGRMMYAGLMDWFSLSTEIMKEAEGEWINQYLDMYDMSENLEKTVGISQKKAKQQADAFMEKLGLEEWAVSYCNPAGFCVGQYSGMQDWGYEFHYTHTVNGVSVLYTDQEVSKMSEEEEANMNLNMDEWTNPLVRYETCSVIVSEDGIESFKMVNLSKLGEVRVKNPALLSWKEITKKFEDMMLVQYAEMREGYESDTYHRYFEIEEVVLSYMRIEEAGTGKFLMVPVWDFLGREWNQDPIAHYMGTDEERHDANGEVSLPWSLMTINALDGTVMDREKGY